MPRTGILTLLLLSACTGKGGGGIDDPVIIEYVDSDGDTIVDLHEGYVDPNNEDGVTSADTDGDGTFDYLDDDSDGDGKGDGGEGLVDSDGDGLPDFLDDQETTFHVTGGGLISCSSTDASGAPLALGLLALVGLRRRRRR